MKIKNLDRRVIGIKEREWKHKKLEKKHWRLVRIECERLRKCCTNRKMINTQVTASEVSC